MLIIIKNQQHILIIKIIIIYVIIKNVKQKKIKNEI